MKKVVKLFACLAISFTLALSACESTPINGITPQLRINETTNEWEVSYDNGGSWASLGVKATGENGKDGEQGEKGEKGETGKNGENGLDGSRVTIGENGNWFIDGVDTGISASSNGGTSGGSTEETDFTPISRFVVTSDVHLQKDGSYQSKERLESVFDTAYTYATSQETYTKLDGIFFVGDITDNGKPEEYELFFDTVESKTQGNTFVRAVMGNHEYYNTNAATGSAFNDYTTESMAQAPLNFIQYSGYDDDDIHTEINGYHYIMVSIDKYGTSTGTANEFLSETKLDWLEEQLDIALEDDPTGEKPIFVFHHIHAQNTVIGSTNHDKGLRELLDNYANVVSFSGHTHRPLTNPLSIWQDTFTALGTGSMAYLTLDGPDGSVMEVNEYGEWVKGSNSFQSARNAVLYYICEIDANNVMRILRYNVLTGNVVGEPIILDSFGDPTGFDYTSARANLATAPTFASDAEITVSSNSYVRTAIRFPQATCNDTVHNYLIEVYSNNALVKTEYRFSRSYLGDAMPENMQVFIPALQPQTEYTIKVFAISCYNEESLPLSTTFTTSTQSTTPVADILSVQFNTDGTATNTVTGTTLKKHGSPTVAADSSIGKNVATFDGSDDAYSFDGMMEWVSTMDHSFTMETYVYVTGTKNSAMAIASAAEEGGFGLQYTTGGAYRFSYQNNSSYKTVEYTAGISQWVHLVFVHDGSTIKLYANGELIQSVSATGQYRPGNSGAQDFFIGAEVKKGNLGSSFCKCKIATLNMYSAALSAEQVSTLYSQYTN